MDVMAIANVKNRVGQNNLLSKLDKMEQVHKTNLRILKNVKRQFRNKYKKHEAFRARKGTEAENVLMYETHNPGFCYRRNGEYKAKNYTSSNTLQPSHQTLRDMLLTGGEVDVEKVLCLHLLTAHNVACNLSNTESPESTEVSSQDLTNRQWDPQQTETSLSEPDYKRISFLSGKKITKDLNGKSTKGKTLNIQKNIKSKWARLLPIYVLQIKDQTNVEDEESDDEEELSSKVYYHKTEITKSPEMEETKSKSDSISLLINSELENLVNSVIEVLQEVNPMKVQEMLKLANNPAALRTLLAKQKIQKFMDSLCDTPLLCDNKLFQLNNAKLYSILRHNKTKKSAHGTKREEEIPIEVSCCSAVDEIAAVNLEIAETPQMRSLEHLISVIRSSVMQEAGQDTASYDKVIKTHQSNSSFSPRRSGTLLDNQKSNSNMPRNSLIAHNTLEHSCESVRCLEKTTLASLARSLTARPMNSRVSRKIQDLKENIDAIDYEKMSTAQSSMQKRKCPACINQWQFSEGNKSAYISSKSQKDTDQKILTTKEIAAILNFVTSHGRKHIPEGILPNTMYPPQETGNTRDVSPHRDDLDSAEKSILRKLSNSQRIQVGRKAASLKTRQINFEGLEGKNKIPLAVFVNSVLSTPSILALARGNKEKEVLLKNSKIRFENLLELERKVHVEQKRSFLYDTENELTFTAAENAEGSSIAKIEKVKLAKIKCEIAHHEIQRKLSQFLKSPNL